MSAEEPIALALGGGWEAGPVRIGDTVRRRSGRWTPAVHALLRHLESVGFDAAPRVLGVDGQGREVLSYIEGQAGNYPLPESLWSDAVLDQTAQLLRRYHDATVGFVPPVDASWLHGVREPVEVICHGDMAPYNCIYRGDRIVCFIDFDWAGLVRGYGTSPRRHTGSYRSPTRPTRTPSPPISLADCDGLWTTTDATSAPGYSTR